MPTRKERVTRALLSVSDKTGIVDLARALAARGVALVSTGGTHRVLVEAGLAVTEVAELTGFPEMMDGRVKTLHPKVHGGLLGRRADPQHQAAMLAHGIAEIDLLVVDLYPFEATLASGASYEQCVEQIDIGGPAMIRAAAKNHESVAVVVDPADYATILDELAAHDGATTLTLRKRLAQKAYARTAAYDAAISGWLADALEVEAPTWRAKLAAVTRADHEVGWGRSVTAIAQRFRWYLVVRTVLGAITGTLYGLWTWAFGLEFALVWGLLGFLLNYIPTLGSIVAGALPIAFAFFTKDFGTALIIGAGLLVIEQVMGNFVDPRLQGKQLSLSPLVVLFSLLVWGWIWGVPGALLAVPLTVLITIVFTHLSGLRRIALMLSDERDLAALRLHRVDGVQPGRFRTGGVVGQRVRAADRPRAEARVVAALEEVVDRSALEQVCRSFFDLFNLPVRVFSRTGRCWLTCTRSAPSAATSTRCQPVRALAR